MSWIPIEPYDRGPAPRTVRVPDSDAPFVRVPWRRTRVKVCWQQDRQTMQRCWFRANHRGECSWGASPDPTEPRVFTYQEG